MPRPLFSMNVCQLIRTPRSRRSSRPSRCHTHHRAFPFMVRLPPPHIACQPPRAVLTSLIAMADGGSEKTCVKRHVQRCNHQVADHAFTKRPTHHFSVVHIHHNGQLQESNPRWHVGHVGHPQLVDSAGHELALDEISRSLGVVTT